jgi:hypothetical protein
MTAYVMKAQYHTPTLTFEMNRRSVCPQSDRAESCPSEFESRGMCCMVEEFRQGSEILDSWCTCYLGDSIRISFAEQQIGLHRALKAKPDDIKPNKDDDVADFSWLVRMSNVQDGKAVHVDDSKIPAATRAGLKFNWLSERSCQLDQEGGPRCDDASETRCDYKIHSFKFKEGDHYSTHRQALAEYAMFELRFPFSTEVVLEDTKHGNKINLDLGCGSRGCPDIMVANLFTGDPSHCDDGVGCHFAEYYNIAAGDPAKYIPYRDDDAFPVGKKQFYSCPDDPFRRKNQAVQKAFGRDTERSTNGTDRVASRIVCPMAMFDP